MAKRSAPEVNAGSMADIAFLLLIFFLVTTTIETDSGLNRKLPPMEDQVDPPIIREKNIFTVLVSKNDQLLVEEELVDIADLRSLAIAFLDNGGGVGDEACDYCQGERNESSSDNPDIICKKYQGRDRSIRIASLLITADIFISVVETAEAFLGES